jgi:hypothetical protein
VLTLSFTVHGRHWVGHTSCATKGLTGVKHGTGVALALCVGPWPTPYSADDAKRSSQALGMSALRHPRNMVWAMFRHCVPILSACGHSIGSEGPTNGAAEHRSINDGLSRGARQQLLVHPIFGLIAQTGAHAVWVSWLPTACCCQSPVLFGSLALSTHLAANGTGSLL